ncbi:MAG: hypothetical protein L6R19_27825 [Alphaproteobacteria bacterium]|nr:hypothetical protein [Alphaproteobacteria bacterium]
MSKVPLCWFRRVADEFDRLATELSAAARAADRSTATELATRAEAIRRDCGCATHAPGEAHSPQGKTPAAKARLRLVER